jgi:hypothetical protein
VADLARGAFASVHRSVGLRQIVWQSSRTGRPQLTEDTRGARFRDGLKAAEPLRRSHGWADDQAQRNSPASPGFAAPGLLYQTKVTSAVTPSALIMLPVVFREATERPGAELRRRPSRHDNEQLVTAQHQEVTANGLL